MPLSARSTRRSVFRTPSFTRSWKAVTENRIPLCSVTSAPASNLRFFTRFQLLVGQIVDPGRINDIGSPVDRRTDILHVKISRIGIEVQQTGILAEMP